MIRRWLIGVIREATAPEPEPEPAWKPRSKWLDKPQLVSHPMQNNGDYGATGHMPWAAQQSGDDRIMAALASLYGSPAEQLANVFDDQEARAFRGAARTMLR